MKLRRHSIGCRSRSREQQPAASPMTHAQASNLSNLAEPVLAMGPPPQGLTLGSAGLDAGFMGSAQEWGGRDLRFAYGVAAERRP